MAENKYPISWKLHIADAQLEMAVTVQCICACGLLHLAKPWSAIVNMMSSWLSVF